MAPEPLIPVGETPFTDEKFRTETFVYKHVEDIPIHVDAYIPKQRREDRKHPLFVLIHGGALVDGARNVPSMTYGPWAAAYTLEHNAIAISPDYRLCPETKSPQIVEDLLSFWEWLHSSLPSLLAAQKIQLDLDRIIVRGESAGGWCALHLGLRFPTQIRALILAWPLTDPGNEHFVKGNGGKPILPGVLDIVVPEETFRAAYLEATESGAAGQIVTGSQLERTPLMLGLMNYGNAVEFMGDYEETFPLRTIRKGLAGLPSLVWVSQGEDDSVVPVKHSSYFVDIVRSAYPDTRVVLDVRPGEHGFDDAVEYSDPWLQERLQMVAKVWVG
ncbi:hypothetical protein M409DRAFT_26880 [Zasmidium cellare ATCC 36951]|uniref:Alpha/beta hydrolase fold-3 domain-containing protein n=1 Tax=Zasmidium cellare ATCC 36951 TaxID=1080233 RepID=A0A6A6CAH1_ZASCE|nr:uncharacterized protein M409DRAFT_26880 [Zasmidium cellare ATCC 36951]KAF2162639.1 hypothetical protein M409DRAFT_26880 [Zasmidium cellare ATCC 36951]